MNIEETTKKVDLLLQDRGLTSEYQEQAVRQLLYHLFVAIEIYKFMTQAERNKSGWWYRTYFKNIFPLSGFLKERKRKRDKEKSPLHPSYKKESGVLEKDEKYTHTPLTREALEQDLRKRRDEFWEELKPFIGEYSRSTVERFFLDWTEDVNDDFKMRKEYRRGFRVAYWLKKWSLTSFNSNDEAADIRLTKAKAGKKKETKANDEQVAAARERMIENERREEERQEAKKNAVSYEEWLAMKAAQEEQNT